jgi:hypothetical protein
MNLLCCSVPVPVRRWFKDGRDRRLLDDVPDGWRSLPLLAWLTFELLVDIVHARRRENTNSRPSPALLCTLQYGMVVNILMLYVHQTTLVEI